ncbi:flagellar hook-basal body complex protein FliE [Alkaliphilus sp. MSJ-5]|uniref:Flagellar hook-basal body complex protein FliE n=1 Tax=Alkaliphilus flagellatus TaxID=2841507 RepID=A0ABS6G4I3_9FIRM|nr:MULTISPECIES: flagellar hook-basal body complex protein FliE [Alkaliphilus]MBU5677410.1 flagellar hook-basal body complex protein FliE [Alkaliphilus flagellatus]QUH20843.1 flagellar hook-basal body complex protein FliE [Alkaliphilus sp. B6464]
MKINNISQLNTVKLGSIDNYSEETSKSTVSFSTFLNESLEKVSSLEKESEQYSLKLATGELENIHEAMIAAQKADIALQLTMQIRNKVLDAYREIMRMQI